MSKSKKMATDELIESKSARRMHGILAVALLAQVACWGCASPGPAIRGAELSFPFAWHSALIAFGTLFVFPLLACKVLSIKLSELGLRVGNWKLGLVFLAIGIPIAGALLFGGCNDSEILASYPWAGEWLANSTVNMLIWFSIYGLYYLAFEFFYRGFLLRGLEPEIGLPAAMWIQVIMSVMIHFGKPSPELLASIPAAFIFGWVAVKTKSILYVFAIHWAIGIFNDLFAMHFKGWL